MSSTRITPIKSRRDVFISREKIRQQARYGETHFVVEPGSSMLDITLPHTYDQAPRVRYFLRMADGSEFALIHHLAAIERDHFGIALFNSYDEDVEGDIYWETFLLE